MNNSGNSVTKALTGAIFRPPDCRTHCHDLDILMNEQDRRRHQRHKIGVHATVITPVASIPVCASDISVNGLRVVCPDPILPETVVAVSLSLKEETLLSGNVLWSIEGKRTGERYYEIGIEIHAIILREMEAIGFSKKAALVDEILHRVNQQ